MDERGAPDLEPLDRAEDGDGRGDDPFAAEERGAEEAGRDEGEAAAPLVGLALLLKEQGEEGQDSALAPVVGAEDEGDVLDADDEDE
jgi:hypothetical protein